MLVLSRKIGQRIVIAGNIDIKVLRIHGNNVHLGVTAQSDISIHRLEAQKKINQGPPEQQSHTRSP